MIKTSLKPILFCWAFLIALPLYALEYDYFEGGLAIYPSFNSQDYIGLNFRASKQLDQLNDNIFTYGGIKYLTDEVDLTAFHIGGAYRFVLDRNTHAWAGMSLDYQNFSNGSSDSDMAFGLRGGLRHQIDNNLEVGGSLRLITGTYDYLGIAGTLRYHWQDNLSWLAEADIYDGNLGILGGLSYSF